MRRPPLHAIHLYARGSGNLRIEDRVVRNGGGERDGPSRGRPDDSLSRPPSFELWQSLQQSWSNRSHLSPPLDSGAHFLAQRARAFIDEHFTEGIRLRDISNSVSITPEYLCTIFRREYGLSPYEYVIERRLDAAARLIREGATVKEAAASVGYVDPGYFSRLYRRKRGVTPSALTPKS